ncbi:hypothetical protein NC652_038020 [Populus alba x Populus x berolinensis]|nr:hypothetical protein NC652_038020 [Populus alba x Populus x berolinensis]
MGFCYVREKQRSILYQKATRDKRLQKDDYFCNEFSVPKDKLEHFKDITPQDIVCSQVVLFTFIKKI